MLLLRRGAPQRRGHSAGQPGTQVRQVDLDERQPAGRLEAQVIHQQAVGVGERHLDALEMTRQRAGGVLGAPRKGVRRVRPGGVVDAEQPELTKARLVLCMAAQVVLAKVLRLLGVSAPANM